MIIIPPLTITDAMLHSSTITEPSTAEAADEDYGGLYNAGTPYTNQQWVIVASSHLRYLSLQNGNVGVTPGGAGSDEWWLVMGSSDQWKPFDAVVSSQVESAGTITYELDPGEPIDSIALMNIEAASIEVTMTDVGGAGVPVVWSVTTYADELYTSDLAKTDFPLTYLTPHIVIVVTPQSGLAKVGEIVLGQQKEIGLTNYSPSIGITDYSIKDVDIFGNYTVLERSYSKRLSCQTTLENTQLDSIYKTLAAIRAIPVVWVGSDLYASMIVYGFFKDFGIVIPYPTMSTCSLEIEGLV